MQIAQQNSQKIYTAARALRRERGKCQPRFNATPKGSKGSGSNPQCLGEPWGPPIHQQDEILGWFLWHRNWKGSASPRMRDELGEKKIKITFFL